MKGWSGVSVSSECSVEELVDQADALNAQLCHTQVQFLQVLASVDRRNAWEGRGAQTMEHWVSIHYGVSYYKAERWVAAGRALQQLPLIRQAFAEGRLSLDKVVELTRFATPAREAALVESAQRV